MTAAFEHVGQSAPAAPAPPQPSGIGKDPRQKFEELHWTQAEREGHKAYAESVRNSMASSDQNEHKLWTDKSRMTSPESAQSEKRSSTSSEKAGSERKAGKVNNMANFWTEKDKQASSAKDPGEKQLKRQSSKISEKIKSLAKGGEKKGPSSESQTSPGRKSTHESVKDQREHVNGPTSPPLSGSSSHSHPKLTHLTKGRARPPKKNRLSASSKES
jgi:hypothetical protein